MSGRSVTFILAGESLVALRRHSQAAFGHIMALLRFFANSSFFTYS